MIPGMDGGGKGGGQFVKLRFFYLTISINLLVLNVYAYARKLTIHTFCHIQKKTQLILYVFI